MDISVRGGWSGVRMGSVRFIRMIYMIFRIWRLRSLCLLLLRCGWLGGRYERAEDLGG